MTDLVHPASAEPRWQIIAGVLESNGTTPTAQQMKFASEHGISIATSLPAPVAAVIIRHHLSDVLLEKRSRTTGLTVPDDLITLESELSLTETATLSIGSQAELSAWWDARFKIKTARGLRELQPAVGDIVTTAKGEKKTVSSVGEDGRVYFKGQGAGSSWPNSLTCHVRVGEAEHAKTASAVEAATLNSASYSSSSFAKFKPLNKYRVPSRVPAPEAVRALEELLESGEENENRFQELITKYPALLSSAVMGHNGTYVIPKPKFGAEYVPDYLILGLNSLGPQWVLVEIESPKHALKMANGHLAHGVRAAVNQIHDWQDWLSENVAYAQSSLGFHGLVASSPGLVIVGRGMVSADRDFARARSEEGDRVTVHTWDWLLRSAKTLSIDPLQVSSFAIENAEISEPDELLDALFPSSA